MAAEEGREDEALSGAAEEDGADRQEKLERRVNELSTQIAKLMGKMETRWDPGGAETQESAAAHEGHQAEGGAASGDAWAAPGADPWAQATQSPIVD